MLPALTRSHSWSTAMTFPPQIASRKIMSNISADAREEAGKGEEKNPIEKGSAGKGRPHFQKTGKGGHPTGGGWVSF